jgi:hypothetical protein
MEAADGPDQFQALFDRCGYWSHRGPDDERGTASAMNSIAVF